MKCPKCKGETVTVHTLKAGAATTTVQIRCGRCGLQQDIKYLVGHDPATGPDYSTAQTWTTGTMVGDALSIGPTFDDLKQMDEMMRRDLARALTDRFVSHMKKLREAFIAHSSTPTGPNAFYKPGSEKTDEVLKAASDTAEVDRFLEDSGLNDVE